MVVFSRICLLVGAVATVGLESFTTNGNDIVSSSITSKSFDSLHNDNEREESVRRLGGYYSVYNDYDKYYGYGGKGSSGSSSDSGSKGGSDSSSSGRKGGSSSGSGSKSGSKSSSRGSGSKSGSSSDSNSKGYYSKMSKYNKYGKGGYGDNSDSSSGRKGSGSDSSSSNGKGGSSSSGSSGSKSKSGSKSGSGSDSSSSGDRRRKGGKRDGKRGGRKDDPKDYNDDKNDDERFALRINCGGLGTDDYCQDYRYFNSNGDLWFHDCEYQDDYDAEIFSVDDTIYDIDEYGNEVEADDQEIYQSERFIRGKDLVYNFDVNNGRYFIKLYFAENFFSTRKERVFDIAVQGEILEYDFDIYERVGKNFALVLQFNDIYVDNYKLSIEFIKNIQDPKVNGIEIFQVE